MQSCTEGNHTQARGNDADAQAYDLKRSVLLPARVNVNRWPIHKCPIYIAEFVK
jgi:hypothetical protein